MGFELFDKRTAGVSKHPYVTIQRKGPFSFNRAAYELLGKPEAVELLYDREQERVGFRPTSPERPQAFPLRSMGKNSATFVVAGQAFSRHYGLDTSIARRYPVRLEDNVLVLDLRGDSVEVTGPRSRSRKDES